jgi:hypothetical protein
MADFYETLGLARGASPAEIRSAYRRLARKYHPDISSSPDANAQFAKINEAYHVLIDPARRASYDRGDYDGSPRTFYARAAEVVAIQREFDRMVDEMLARERRESAARFEAVLVVVPLFLSAFYVVASETRIEKLNSRIGQAAVIALALYGLFYLVKNISKVLRRYTYHVPDHLTSVFGEEKPPDKPISRRAGLVFLVCGYVVSIGLGYIASKFLPASDQAKFLPGGILSALLYPPIAVLLVGVIRRIALFFERF